MLSITHRKYRQSTNPQVLWSHLQPAAHVQEVRHATSVQQDVDGDGAPRRRLHQVLQDVQVRQQVHHYGNHLSMNITQVQARVNKGSRQNGLRGKTIISRLMQVGLKGVGYELWWNLKGFEWSDIHHHANGRHFQNSLNTKTMFVTVCRELARPAGWHEWEG